MFKLRLVYPVLDDGDRAIELWKDSQLLNLVALECLWLLETEYLVIDLFPRLESVTTPDNHGD
jgi:hypothetical protein